MHGGGAADGVGAHLRQADVAHVAGLDHLGDGADGVLDRHVRIEARGAVDVDVIDTQTLQRIGEEVLYRRWPTVVAEEGAVRRAQGAGLYTDGQLVAVQRLKRFADQHLVVTHAVEVAVSIRVTPASTAAARVARLSARS